MLREKETQINKFKRKRGGGRVRAPVGKETKNGNVALQTIDFLGVRAASIVLHRVRACHHKIKVGRAFIYGDNLVTPPFIKKRRVKNITFSGSHLSTAHPLPSHGDIPGQMHQSTASTDQLYRWRAQSATSSFSFSPDCTIISHCNLQREGSAASAACAATAHAASKLKWRVCLQA